MDAALAIGRIVLVIIFMFSGLGKLMDISGTAALIASKGLPLPQLLAVGAGIGELAGALAIAVGWQTRLAAVGLILFTAVAAFFIHDFWNLPEGAEREDQMIHAMKNLSMIGGLIVLAAAGAVVRRRARPLRRTVGAPARFPLALLFRAPSTLADTNPQMRDVSCALARHSWETCARQHVN